MMQTTIPDVGSDGHGEGTRNGEFYRPVVDIIEGSNELVVVADMPGAKSDEIDIRFEDGSLTIHGRIAQRRPEGASLLLEEYGIGDFQRTFRVGEQIDASRISAEYSTGVLRLRLPKAEAAMPRKIKVEAK